MQFTALHMEYWSAGVLECWNEVQQKLLKLNQLLVYSQYSITPPIQYSLTHCLPNSRRMRKSCCFPPTVRYAQSHHSVTQPFVAQPPKIIIIYMQLSCNSEISNSHFSGCSKGKEPGAIKSYRLSHIKFHKARGRRLYCNTPTTDNAVKFNM